jgi:hypothetical protein
MRDDQEAMGDLSVVLFQNTFEELCLVLFAFLGFTLCLNIQKLSLK